MAATFPGGVKTFSTKAPGNAIQSAHINDLQAEVVAVETELLDKVLVRYAVKAYRDATTFTLTTSGTLYTVPLNQETYDTHNQHDNSTNPTRLTCAKTGMYLIQGTVTFTANATGNRDALIIKNGTAYVGNQSLSANASGTTTVNVFAIAALTAGDYIELQARQYSGGSLTINYADDTNNQMTMTRLGE